MSANINNSLEKPFVKNITTNASVVLDALRLLAALLVFVEHARAIWFPEEIYSGVNISHVAVIVFFVLSGYVIAYTTTVNNRGVEQYAVARLSRLYSIILPAIILTIIIETIIYFIDPAIHALDYTRGPSWPRYIVTSVFMNEVWFLTAGPRMNGPLWSLSFECWYYIIFGFWLFRSRDWKGILLVLLVVVYAGPKIIVMMPVWLMGCAAYKIRAITVEPVIGWMIAISSFTCAVLSTFYLPEIPFKLGTLPFVFAAQFVTDWIIGFFIAVALWSIPYYEIKQINKKIADKIRKVADLTFPIYVLHFPFLSLWYVSFGLNQNNYWDMYLGSIIVLIIISVIGVYLESKRKLWTNWFNNIIHKLGIIFFKKVYNKKSYESR